jgi:hypothetical protein
MWLSLVVGVFSGLKRITSRAEGVRFSLFVSRFVEGNDRPLAPRGCDGIIVVEVRR